jgi:hypothetical protein
MDSFPVCSLAAVLVVKGVHLLLFISQVLIWTHLLSAVVFGHVIDGMPVVRRMEVCSTLLGVELNFYLLACSRVWACD